MHRYQLFFFYGLTIISTHTHAADLIVQSFIGHDSNPFKLSDNLKSSSTTFIENKLQLSHEHKNIKIRGGLSIRNHDNSSEDADSKLWNLKIRSKYRHKLFSKPSRSSLVINFLNKDKTYVMRSTGRRAQSGSDNIGDRYDYSQWSSKVQTHVSYDKFNSFNVSFEYKIKDYKNYAIKELSDLDYKQYSLQNKWKYAQDKHNNFNLSLILSKQKYENKNQKDPAGENILGTNLVYNSAKIKAAYEHKLTNAASFQLKSSYEKRKDNGTGYYDNLNKHLGFALNYTPKNSMHYNFELFLHEKQYINSNNFDPNNDGEPSKDGYFAKLILRQKIESWQWQPTLFAHFRYENYNSDQPIYEYDRLQIKLGAQVIF